MRALWHAMQAWNVSVRRQPGAGGRVRVEDGPREDRVRETWHDGCKASGTGNTRTWGGSNQPSSVLPELEIFDLTLFDSYLTPLSYRGRTKKSNRRDGASPPKTLPGNWERCPFVPKPPFGILAHQLQGSRDRNDEGGSSHPALNTLP